MYVNGKCVAQDHTVQLIETLSRLGIITIPQVSAYNDPYLDSHARFPDDVNDVVPDDEADLVHTKFVRTTNEGKKPTNWSR